jgi:hypothetical protein
MAKKRVTKKENCKTNNSCDCKILLIVLTSMAFLLFLLTAWGGFAVALMSFRLAWAWYLALTVLLAVLLFSENCWCGKK